jgi:hypothetical protein
MKEGGQRKNKTFEVEVACQMPNCPTTQNIWI